MNEPGQIAGKIELMLTMQDEMNRAVDADWLQRGRAWYRAIWIECAELMDHYGTWKWWKHGQPDHEQALLEIVDIWHFGLSLRMHAGEPLAHTAAGIAEDWCRPLDSAGFLADVETLASFALVERQFKVAVIPVLLGQIDRDFNDLFSHYVGKSVLNLFRQANGYRDGSYRKQWQGREDNEHLSEILAALDVDAPDYRQAVEAALSARYRELPGD